jgi:hypothetical protein
MRASIAAQIAAGASGGSAPRSARKDVGLFGGKFGETEGEGAAHPLGVELRLARLVGADRPQLAHLVAAVATGDVVAMPKSHGRALARSGSKRARASKARKKVCAVASSA